MMAFLRRFGVRNKSARLCFTSLCAASSAFQPIRSYLERRKDLDQLTHDASAFASAVLSLRGTHSLHCTVSGPKTTQQNYCVCTYTFSPKLERFDRLAVHLRNWKKTTNGFVVSLLRNKPTR